jgi:hypothetical protein
LSSSRSPTDEERRVRERKERERWMKRQRERLMRKLVGEGGRRWKGVNGRTEELD